MFLTHIAELKYNINHDEVAAVSGLGHIWSKVVFFGVVFLGSYFLRLR